MEDDRFMLFGPNKKDRLPRLKLKLKTLIVNAEQTKFMCWTPTAIELWSDEKFLVKRINEQRNYLLDLTRKNWAFKTVKEEKWSEERFVELRDAAFWQMDRYKERLIELVKK